MTITLSAHWQLLVESHDIDWSQAKAAYDQIVASYGEPQRYYHTLAHLQHFVDQLLPISEISDEVWFALYYHDIVYKIGRKDNERKSAALATEVLGRWQLPIDFIDRVEKLIIATQTHQCEQSDEQACLFLDGDMAILGSTLPDYLNYAAQVRQEHHRFPDFLYNRGRGKFLQQTLDCERIFLSDHFYRLYESQARDNIAAELANLGCKS